MKIFKLVLLALAVSGTAYAQTSDKVKAVEGPSEKEMAAWTAYMTPGEMHKVLASSTGTWDAVVTMWMAPGAPPQKTKGVMEVTMILGDRYQQSTHRMEWDGMPFEGTSITGYDNIQNKFHSIWIDNFGTGMMKTEGTFDPKTMTTRMSGKMMDPISGKELPMREVIQVVDENHHTMEMYCTTDKGKEYQTMRIDFSRRK